jgi:hypothetical protein
MPILKPPPLPPATLAQKIEQIHADVESLIQVRIAAEMATAPGVPEGVIRQMFNARYGKCKCVAYQQMQFDALSEADREAAREKAQIAAVEKLSRESAEAAATMGEQK